MELRIKVKFAFTAEINEIVKEIRNIEKEYSCNCTLLEIEANRQPEVYQSSQEKK